MFHILADSGEVEFLVKAAGPLRLKFTQEGSTMNGERIALTPWEPTNLEQYPGVYWAKKLETQYASRSEATSSLRVMAQLEASSVRCTKVA